MARCMTRLQATASIAVLALCAASSGSAHAEEGTIAQQAACAPDVKRLCSQFIPDSSAITNCLRHNKSRLNAECKAVMQGRLK